MVSFRCFCAGSRVRVLCHSQGSWSVWKSEKSERKKKSRQCNRERAKNRGKREEESL